MQQLFDTELPGLRGRVSVGNSSEGDCLSLFAEQSFEKGEEIFRWPVASDTVMLPKEETSDKLASGDYGALAFQVLKAVRSAQDTGPWGAWVNAGAQAPDTHPLKLLFSDTDTVRQLWSSTTCGGRMSAAALQLKEDMELLGGSASLEEWADAVALVMSRSIVADDLGRPLLVFGLDLLQDGDAPNVRAITKYEKVGTDFFGGGGEEVFSEVVLVAARDLEAGEELSTQYLSKPHAGKYMELYGFVPETLLLGEFPPTCAELSFAPSDEEDDPGFYTKESLLENQGFSTDPIPFVFCTQDGIAGPPDTEPEWEKMDAVSRMTFILRLRHMGGKEAFLLDAVYADDAWDNCHYYISKDNEILVCTSVIEECDRWLERFDKADEADKEAPPAEGSLAAMAAVIRRNERDVIDRVRNIFIQELRDATYTESRQYWVDRQLNVVFPERGRRGTKSLFDNGFLD